jgi:uncharacterized RDD family membrane protein YckC
MQWFYAVNNQRLGPVSPAEFEQLVATGVIKPDTLVWCEGMTGWQPYSAVAVTAGSGAADDGTELCIVSGKRYPRREMIQYEGRWISAEHRDEFFQRVREGVTQPGLGTVPGPFGYGGFWRRFWAKFVDGLILKVVGVLLNMLVSLALFGTYNYFNGVDPYALANRGIVFTLITTCIALATNLAYFWYFMARYAATPGKLAFGMKVVRSDGSALSTGRIIGRFFAEWLSSLTIGIGYLMAAFDEEKRSLHDRICDTRVIRTK